MFATNDKKDGNHVNRFDLGEFRGAVGDLGTTLPLAFMLIISSGFPVARIFLLWGFAYILVGWFYKVPVSIQPLKAVAVIAITEGLSATFLSSTAVIYGLLLLTLSMTGLIRWIRQWFSKALIRGIQLGIGLLLAGKAWKLVTDQALYLDGTGKLGGWILLLAGLVLLLLIIGQWKLNRTVGLEIIVVSLAVSVLAGIRPAVEQPGGGMIVPGLPDLGQWWDMVTMLIIPQLPLTLGNAVYAADDACHSFWPKQSKRVSPTRLGGSIGILDVLIGLMGGFPVCHGAGGIAAHRRFGGKTGGTVIIIGIVLVLLSFSNSLDTLLFLIPIPVLGVLLLFDSWQMVKLTSRLRQYHQVIVALAVGLISFFTHNLTLALLIGYPTERLLSSSPMDQYLQQWVSRYWPL